MRIISGKHKGKQIPVPKKIAARPTTDFAKEGLFNILANYFIFQDMSVLDLFAGTGSIGFEFASRGAREVDMIEIDQRRADFIRKTAKMFDFEKVRIICSDVFRLVPHLKKKYDLIFADPPYQMEGIINIPDLVINAGLLKSKGWFILEHGKDYDFSPHPYFRNLRKYGSVYFSIFQ